MSTKPWSEIRRVRSPRAERNHQRRLQVWITTRKIENIVRWPRWPVMQVVWSFWKTIFDEGIRETCTPRWGAMTFAYLNDGTKPTLWHTLYQITHDDLAPYAGIYPDGAPRSLREAKTIEAKAYAEER